MREKEHKLSYSDLINPNMCLLSKILFLGGIPAFIVKEDFLMFGKILYAFYTK